MKRFAYYIACCTLVVLCACTHDDTDDVIPAGNGKITIQASLDDMAITRADVKDTQAERKITHIDVFAVDSDGNIDYYERNTAGNNNGANDEDGSGVLTLNVARRAKSGSDFVFAQDEEYKFYLVANATAAKSEMEAIKTLAALQQLVQNDSFIPNETGWTGGEQTLLHLTGTTGLGVNPDKEVPETFLMDAVATDAQSNDAFVVNSSEGNLTNLNLSAEFKRAAAKIIVNITQGEDVEFRIEMIETNGTSQTSQTSQYDFIELPVSTFVLPSDENLVDLKRVNTNPMVPNDQTFVWASEEPAATNSIQVVGYAYAHFWDNANLKNETSLILNIPMMWNKDDSEDKSKEEAAPRSWYKVPLSKDKKFERNKCYVVNVTINAVGAANRSTAIELENIEYKTLDWVGVSIDVGNDENRPAYLELNTDLVEIYNANFDNTSLSFSSSSAITSVTLKDVYKQNDNGTFTSETDSYYAYYINKFGVKTQLNQTIRNTISATAEKNVLNGAISILSPIVPAKPAEIEKQILEQLGPAPTAPTLTEPTYDGTIPTAPDVVNQPTEPNPNDYLQETTTTETWPNQWETTRYYRENGNETTNENNALKRVRTRTGTITEKNYQYIESNGTYTFQIPTITGTKTQTETITRSRTSRNWDDYRNTKETLTSDWVNIETSGWTTDTTTQTRWNTALTQYNNQVAAYEKYLDDLADYNADMEALNNNPAYQTYLAEKQAYDNAWAAYNDELADYNEQANDIREAAKGEETHYNTIRYLEFEVENEQGMRATFRVMQYPVIYITHVMGYYSYRDDFNGTTWEKRGNPSSINNCDWSSGKWTYTHNTSDRDDAGIFRSKVYNPGGSTGNYPIDYYYWGSNGRSFYNAGSLSNPRMYHVRVTATSDTYIVGRPRFIDDNGNPSSDIENGFTDDSDENAKLVSPSFMLASQLGATQSPGTDDEDMPVAADHCRQYVEVADDGTEYHDWRLPTAAEIDIIIKLQNNSQAMDEVLSGVSYWSASGIKATGVSGASGTGRIRCVRDAY